MNELITPKLILLDAEADSKEEIIRKLAKLIENEDRLIDYDGYVAQVFKREEEFATSFGFEVAIPHGKSDAVKSAALAFARLKNDIQWSEEEKVKYVFLIAVPESEAGDRHLRILAQISRGLMREEFRNKLKNAENEEELLQALTF